VRVPRRPTLVRVGAAAASGALCALSRPPFDVGPLACIALVPLFVVWRDRGARGSAGYAFVAGIVYYSILCSWIWYFGTIAIVPFVAICGGYWAAAGAVIGWLRSRGITNPFLTAAMWVVADACVSRFPFGGFSWGELGYAFHDIAPARAVAGIGGLTLITFLAVALNALGADLLAAGRSARRYATAYVGVALIAIAVVVSTVTRAQPRVDSFLRVALIQGNDKNRDLTDAELDDRYLPKSHFDLATRITDPVDLIVFPESSMDRDPRTDPFVHDNLVRVAREHHAWVLANATVDADPEGRRAENLDVLFGPDGEIVGTYSKHHLVPFGEYVPFRGELQGWIPALRNVPRDFVRGKTTGLFDVAGTRVATVICFESAFGPEVRSRVRDGAAVIIVSTNNRSYRRSANSAQHLAFGQIRAAETGRPVIQAAISGITAVIDADGAVHDETHLFDRTVVQRTVGATTGETFYLQHGEWALEASIAAVLIAGIGALVRRRRRPSVESQPDGVVPIASRIEGYGDGVPAPHEHVRRRMSRTRSHD
jgi:apolipoprotein N-acyltransferase